MTAQHSDTKPQVNDTVVSSPAAGAPAGKKLSQRERRKRRCLRSLLLVAVTILCVNAAVTSLLISWRAPTVVSFDMKGTIDQFTGQAGEQSLSEEQTKALTARFMASLGDELYAWQTRHDALILVAPAVVGGASDITEEIQAAVAIKMTAGGGQ